MKGKEITSASPMEGVFDFLSAIGSGERQDRKRNLFQDKFNNIIVDTCIPTDTHTWETGIRRGEGGWIIVSQYKNRKEAQAGHKGWVELLSKDPEAELKDIDLWGLGL